MMLAKAGYAVTAFDASTEMLRMACERANATGVCIDAVLGDAQLLPFADNTFDCVCSRNLVWNLELPQTAYREWLRVLKPGGVLLILTVIITVTCLTSAMHGYIRRGKTEATIRCSAWMPA